MLQRSRFRGVAVKDALSLEKSARWQGLAGPTRRHGTVDATCAPVLAIDHYDDVPAATCQTAVPSNILSSTTVYDGRSFRSSHSRILV
jgi:hypothetical protein